jgi:hypothetical protein
MKRVLALAALLVCGIAAPAMADQGHVPSHTLGRLGLAGMHSLSDAEGMEVRGMGGGGIVAVMGKSIVSGLIISPNTKNFIGGTSTNMGMGNAEHAGGHFGDHHGHQGHGDEGSKPVLSINSTQASFIGLQLQVVQNLDVFNGVLIGGAGGSATASLK